MTVQSSFGLLLVAWVAGCMAEPGQGGDPSGTSPEDEPIADAAAERRADVRATLPPDVVREEPALRPDAGGIADTAEASLPPADAASDSDSMPALPARRSAGCGTRQVGGRFDRTLTVEGATRRYLLTVPEGYDGGTALPLVFWFHGSQRIEVRRNEGLEREAAGKAILVYPEALESPAPYRRFQTSEAGPDFKLFDALLADLPRTYCVDLRRVFVAGHSAGAHMTRSLGCFRGDRIRGIGLIAVTSPLASCRHPVSAWIAHGTADTNVEYTKGVANAAFWSKLAGCSADTVPAAPAPCRRYEGCMPGYSVDWCSHEGAHNIPAWAAAGLWSLVARHP